MFRVVVEYFRFSIWKPGRMAPMSNLTARFVPPGEEDMHKLPESGWYAFDDKNIPAGGPFFSEEGMSGRHYKSERVLDSHVSMGESPGRAPPVLRTRAR
jgi:hypothetical protein